MSAIIGRPRRPRNSGASTLPIMGGRVRPETHAKAHRQAAAYGMTLAMYLEWLVQRDPDLDAPEQMQLAHPDKESRGPESKLTA